MKQQWVGQVHHNGFLLAALSVLGEDSMKLEIPDNLELNQKADLNEFLLYILGSQELEFHKPVVAHNNSLYLCLVKLVHENYKKNWSTFIKLLESTNSVGLSSIQNGSVFFIPASFGKKTTVLPQLPDGFLESDLVSYGVIKVKEVKTEQQKEEKDVLDSKFPNDEKTKAYFASHGYTFEEHKKSEFDSKSTQDSSPAPHPVPSVPTDKRPRNSLGYVEIDLPLHRPVVKNDPESRSAQEQQMACFSGHVTEQTTTTPSMKQEPQTRVPDSPAHSTDRSFTPSQPPPQGSTPIGVSAISTQATASPSTVGHAQKTSSASISGVSDNSASGAMTSRSPAFHMLSKLYLLQRIIVGELRLQHSAARRVLDALVQACEDSVHSAEENAALSNCFDPAALTTTLSHLSNLYMLQKAFTGALDLDQGSRVKIIENLIREYEAKLRVNPGSELVKTIREEVIDLSEITSRDGENPDVYNNPRTNNSQIPLPNFGEPVFKLSPISISDLDSGSEKSEAEQERETVETREKLNKAPKKSKTKGEKVNKSKSKPTETEKETISKNKSSTKDKKTKKAKVVEQVTPSGDKETKQKDVKKKKKVIEKDIDKVTLDESDAEEEIPKKKSKRTKSDSESSESSYDTVPVPKSTSKSTESGVVTKGKPGKTKNSETKKKKKKVNQLGDTQETTDVGTVKNKTKKKTAKPVLIQDSDVEINSHENKGAKGKTLTKRKPNEPEAIAKKKTKKSKVDTNKEKTGVSNKEIEEPIQCDDAKPMKKKKKKIIETEIEAKKKKKTTKVETNEDKTDVTEVKISKKKKKGNTTKESDVGIKKKKKNEIADQTKKESNSIKDKGAGEKRAHNEIEPKSCAMESTTKKRKKENTSVKPVTEQSMANSKTDVGKKTYFCDSDSVILIQSPVHHETVCLSDSESSRCVVSPVKQKKKKKLGEAKTKKTKKKYKTPDSKETVPDSNASVKDAVAITQKKKKGSKNKATPSEVPTKKKSTKKEERGKKKKKKSEDVSNSSKPSTPKKKKTNSDTPEVENQTGNTEADDRANMASYLAGKNTSQVNNQHSILDERNTDFQAIPFDLPSTNRVDHQPGGSLMPHQPGPIVIMPQPLVIEPQPMVNNTLMFEQLPMGNSAAPGVEAINGDKDSFLVNTSFSTYYASSDDVMIRTDLFNLDLEIVDYEPPTKRISDFKKENENLQSPGNDRKDNSGEKHHENLRSHGNYPTDNSGEKQNENLRSPIDDPNDNRGEKQTEVRHDWRDKNLHERYAYYQDAFWGPTNNYKYERHSSQVRSRVRGSSKESMEYQTGSRISPTWHDNSRSYGDNELGYNANEDQFWRKRSQSFSNRGNAPSGERLSLKDLQQQYHQRELPSHRLTHHGNRARGRGRGGYRGRYRGSNYRVGFNSPPHYQREQHTYFRDHETHEHHPESSQKDADKHMVDRHASELDKGAKLSTNVKSDSVFDDPKSVGKATTTNTDSTDRTIDGKGSKESPFFVSSASSDLNRSLSTPPDRRVLATSETPLKSDPPHTPKIPDAEMNRIRNEKEAHAIFAPYPGIDKRETIQQNNRGRGRGKGQGRGRGRGNWRGRGRGAAS